MTLDDVPADKIMTLTDELDRLFKAAGCEPACHACSVGIESGEEFQLLSFHGTDEMLCHKCTREDLEEQRREKERRQREREEYIAKYRHGNTGPRMGGGYSRPTAHGSQGTTG